MVQSRYSHIVRVFIADRFYREAKQLVRDERNEKFCRLRTNREILSVCARCPLRLVFSVAILPWSSDTRWRSSERGRRRKQKESGATRAREGKRRGALFPSLFPQTFPAAPLLPNRFFHRDRTCVFCVRGGYRIRSRKFPADSPCTASSTSAFSNRSYLDPATENAFCSYSRFVRLLSMHRNYNPVASMERIVFFLWWL